MTDEHCGHECVCREFRRRERLDLPCEGGIIETCQYDTRSHPAPAQQQASATDNLVVVEVDGVFHIHHAYMNDRFSLIRSDVKELVLKCIPEHDAEIAAKARKELEEEVDFLKAELLRIKRSQEDHDTAISDLTAAAERERVLNEIQDHNDGRLKGLEILFNTPSEERVELAQDRYLKEAYFELTLVGHLIDSLRSSPQPENRQQGPDNKFVPDGFHCPNSCLCSMCRNDKKCETPCALYTTMARDCTECDETPTSRCYARIQKQQQQEDKNE